MCVYCFHLYRITFEKCTQLPKLVWARPEVGVFSMDSFVVSCVEEWQFLIKLSKAQFEQNPLKEPSVSVTSCVMPSQISLPDFSCLGRFGHTARCRQSVMLFSRHSLTLPMLTKSDQKQGHTAQRHRPTWHYDQCSAYFNVLHHGLSDSNFGHHQGFLQARFGRPPPPSKKRRKSVTPLKNCLTIFTLTGLSPVPRC